MATTRTIEVKCLKCGRHMYDSDRKETVMCNLCRSVEIQETKLRRQEMLEEKRLEEFSDWHVRREHPDSKMY